MEKQLAYRGNEVSYKSNPNFIIPVLTAIFFIVLMSISLYKMFYDVKISSDVVIVKDVKELARIFEKIDKDCKILNFEHQKTRVNFLQVRSFDGSEIGSMSLAYPKNWKGPYIGDNPTVQGQEYQVIKTKKGLFVTPGYGVKLGNGKIVGKDIILDENADIQKMAQDGGDLNFNGQAMATKINVKSKKFGKIIMENIIRMDDIAKNDYHKDAKILEMAMLDK